MVEKVTMNEDVKLGPCCGCEKEGPFVRNIITLDKKAPIAGRGWGCVVCDLPSDGALAVLCDNCLYVKRSDEDWKPKHACVGYPAKDGRVAFDSLTGEHSHDLSKHPEHDPSEDEIFGACRLCGCTEAAACSVMGVPCMWVNFNVCSSCASVSELLDVQGGLAWLREVVRMAELVGEVNP